ncbi:MAG TPA: curli assembly protein CsgF [Draconibacterium sp.]|jgi:curli production assembly/transport component CsgF|nr:curli assembly protein CsgF [Draconibacterium sp.]
MKKSFLIFAGFLLLLSIRSNAQQFVYTPINPAFGGNTFNYQWMLSSAQAQDTYKAPTIDGKDPYGMYSTNPVDDFAESLNRQILSRLSRELVTRQFGEEALAEGSYVLGDYQIDIGNSDNGLNITIVDNTTGATTNVEVPYF